jgi:hypothetical protein
MTHIITIETENQTDFTLLKNLAQRLNLNIKEEHKSAKEAKSDLLDKVAGRWEGSETGDELNLMIQQSRFDNPREIEL